MAASLGIVVPAFDPDVERLTTYVSELDERFPDAQIHIELDAPGAGIVEALTDLPASINAVPYRRGKGAAVTAGFERLDTAVLSFVDADGSTPVDSLAAVLEPVLSGRAALAVGSRRHPQADVESHQTFARRFLGDGFAWLAGKLLTVSLSDYQCGAKAITRAGWEQIREHLYEPGFAWDIELIAMAGAFDLRVEEVPIRWEDQPNSSVAPIRTTIRMGRTLLAVRHRAKRLADDSLHQAIADRRGAPTALVDRDE